MKRGRRTMHQQTYQFEVTATDFRYDRYKKHLSNPKIRNFVIWETSGKNGKNYGGYITPMRPVLITTVKNWLDCTENQLWPVYTTKYMWERVKRNHNTLIYKFNGVEELPTNQEYRTDWEELDWFVDKDPVQVAHSDAVVEEEDYEELDAIGTDIDEGGAIIDYKQETINRSKKLREMGLMSGDDDDLEHYIASCHRKHWDVESYKDWVWTTYDLFVLGLKSKHNKEVYHNGIHYKNIGNSSTRFKNRRDQTRLEEDDEIRKWVKSVRDYAVARF